MGNQSTFTGAAAVTFAIGLVLMFSALYRDAARGGLLLWVGLVLLAAAIVCWFMSARAEKA